MLNTATDISLVHSNITTDTGYHITEISQGSTELDVTDIATDIGREVVTYHEAILQRIIPV